MPRRVIRLLLLLLLLFLCCVELTSATSHATSNSCCIVVDGLPSDANPVAPSLLLSDVDLDGRTARGSQRRVRGDEGAGARGPPRPASSPRDQNSGLSGPDETALILTMVHLAGVESLPWPSPCALPSRLIHPFPHLHPAPPRLPLPPYWILLAPLTSCTSVAPRPRPSAPSHGRGPASRGEPDSRPWLPPALSHASHAISPSPPPHATHPGHSACTCV